MASQFPIRTYVALLGVFCREKEKKKLATKKNDDTVRTYDTRTYGIGEAAARSTQPGLMAC